MNGMLFVSTLLLASAVVVVPLAQYLGLGAVLGYLIAGLAIGPSGFGLITDTSSLGEVSELGVVFLLFILGMELEPKRLWNLKLPIFGMGGAQIVLVTAITTGVCLLLGLPLASSVVIGLAFTNSGTSIATQILRDRGLINTPLGGSAFSILLFQDLSIIPILALLPLLAGQQRSVQGQPLWVILIAMVGVVVAGRLLLRHIFRIIAQSQIREIFTALCLLMVLGLAALMHALGLSMGLGAFMGGILLATSEYRHAVETDIEPFKGLLLGLFFMSVGMEIDVVRVLHQPSAFFFVLLGIILLKSFAHALLGFLFRVNLRELPFFAMILAQEGEFSFVLFASGNALGLLTIDQTAVLSAAAALSMGTTPLLVRVYDRWVAPHLAPCNEEGEEQMVANDNPEVIIAGFGRVGQIVGRMLYANRLRATVMDHDPELIESVRRFGFKVYYGDATRLDLLHSSGASLARVLVVAVDDVNASLQIVDLAKEHFPHLRLVVRARNIDHVYKLMDREVEIWERETFDASIRMGTSVLELLGFSPYQAVRTGMKFREHNLRSVATLASLRSDRKEMISAAKQARDDLEKLLAGERQVRDEEGGEWNAPPPPLH